MLKGKDALDHFERVGRALAKTRVRERLPRTTQEVLKQMRAIDSRSGRGTPDPMGGDLSSHVAHVEFFRAWVEKHGERDESR